MSNVLVVEDDLLMADMLQEALEAEGYSVSGVAHTVAEAKRSAERSTPDFAVIDIRLANGELGTDVGTYLRANTQTLIIYSTGNSIDPELCNAKGDAVMTKPYRLRDVARGLQIIKHLGDRHKRPAFLATSDCWSLPVHDLAFRSIRFAGQPRAILCDTIHIYGSQLLIDSFSPLMLREEEPSIVLE